MLYGFEPNEDDPDSYHVVRQDPNGNWSAAVGSLGIVSEIKDPQVHTNAFYNKCMQDLGGTPLIIDDKKQKDIVVATENNKYEINSNNRNFEFDCS